jgi:hypothetical protein
VEKVVVVVGQAKNARLMTSRSTHPLPFASGIRLLHLKMQYSTRGEKEKRERKEEER